MGLCQDRGSEGRGIKLRIDGTVFHGGQSSMDSIMIRNGDHGANMGYCSRDADCASYGTCCD